MSGSHGIIYRIDKPRWVMVVGDGFAVQDDPGAYRSSSGCPMVTVSMPAGTSLIPRSRYSSSVGAGCQRPGGAPPRSRSAPRAAPAAALDATDLRVLGRSILFRGSLRRRCGQRQGVFGVTSGGHRAAFPRISSKVGPTVSRRHRRSTTRIPIAAAETRCPQRAGVVHPACRTSSMAPNRARMSSTRVA